MSTGHDSHPNPVLKTGKTSRDVDMETNDSADRVEERMELGNEGLADPKPVCETGETSLVDTELTVLGVSEVRLDQRLRKRKRESQSDPRTRKRLRSKRDREMGEESEGEGKEKGEEEMGEKREGEKGEGEEREGPDEVKSKCPRIAVTTDDNIVTGGNEGAEFDISILTDNTINNCNIIHVCCGGEGVVTFDPTLGKK